MGDSKNIIFGWKIWGWSVCLILIIIVITSILTGLWVLTAIPIGFLFGFFLEKADLCGASAFSEVLLMKDWRKIWGIWVVIAVSMIVFFILSAIGLIKLNPKPLLWASYVVGGLLFGTGIVFAGGCVSGCLFKTGQGNINSMAGLIGIPLGVAAVEYGPLHGFSNYLQQFIIRNSNGGSVTIASVTGLPFGLLAIIFGILTLIVVWSFKRRSSSNIPNKRDNNMTSMQRWLTRPWRPWQAGIAIGILAGLAYMSSAASGRNYPLGVTHGVLQTELLVTDSQLKYTYKPSPPSHTTAPKNANPSKNVSLWLVFEVAALVFGSLFSAKLSGKIRFIPRPPDETVVAFFGGILLGAGAAIAGGCVIGNIMSGLALMSVGMIIFTATVLLANWITTYFYLMGGTPFDIKGYVQSYLKLHN